MFILAIVHYKYLRKTFKIENVWETLSNINLNFMVELDKACEYELNYFKFIWFIGRWPRY